VRRDTVREHVFGAFRPRQFDQLRVLDDVSLEIERGETVGIMGRNGSGKSTLLKVLCGIYPPDAGRVDLRAPITPILELGVGWNGELNAIDNIYLLASVMGLPLKAIKPRLDEILAFAEVERFAELKLKFYSSGMASRLAYAVAFSGVREMVVLDEIFAVGDAGFKAKCEERYRQLRAAGHTVVLVSHNPNYVRLFCDRAVLFEGGRVVFEGLPDRVADLYLARLVPQ
jgi:ABC-type polysaccharide/polyol phosphate transport system ATPase subunit